METDAAQEFSDPFMTSKRQLSTPTSQKLSGKRTRDPKSRGTSAKPEKGITDGGLNVVPTALRDVVNTVHNVLQSQLPAWVSEVHQPPRINDPILRLKYFVDTQNHHQVSEVVVTRLRVWVFFNLPKDFTATLLTDDGLPIYLGPTGWPDKAVNASHISTSPSKEFQYLVNESLKWTHFISCIDCGVQLAGRELEETLEDYRALPLGLQKNTQLRCWDDYSKRMTALGDDWSVARKRCAMVPDRCIELAALGVTASDVLDLETLVVVEDRFGWEFESLFWGITSKEIARRMAFERSKKGVRSREEAQAQFTEWRLRRLQKALDAG